MICLYYTTGFCVLDEIEISFARKMCTRIIRKFMSAFHQCFSRASYNVQRSAHFSANSLENFKVQTCLKYFCSITLQLRTSICFLLISRKLLHSRNVSENNAIHTFNRIRKILDNIVCFLNATVFGSN